MSHNASRDHSPIRPSDSPVSIEETSTPQQANNGSAANEDVPVVHLTPKPQADESKASTAEPTKKQKLNWRKTFTGSSVAGSESSQEPVPVKKEQRRRTLMASRSTTGLHAISYADVKAGEPPQLRDTLKDELPSAKTAEYKGPESKEAEGETEYGQHPAVRPLSIDGHRPMVVDGASSTTSSRKGKDREVGPHAEADSDATSMTSSVPSYSKCTCCGRIQKVGGAGSDLSPVLENENLRTNFSFEAERQVPTHRRRASSMSSNQHKYTAIIPMEVGKETRQSRFEARKTSTPSVAASEPPPKLRGVAVNKLGDVIGPSSIPLAIMPKSKDKPKFVRFASLHMTEEEKKELMAKQQSVQVLAPESRAQVSRFGSLYGRRQENQQQPKQEQHQPNQSAYQVQQQPQSAYQAQQSRPVSQATSHRPIRSSRLAYESESVGTPEPTRVENYTVLPPTTANAAEAIEKPLGDSPASSRSNTLTQEEDLSDDDGGPVVDLSSFDGSFVQRSLSRSATVMRSPLGSPTSPVPPGSPVIRNFSRPGTPANTGKRMEPASTTTTTTALTTLASPTTSNFIIEPKPIGIPQTARIDTSGTSSFHHATTDASTPATASATEARFLAASIPGTPTPIDIKLANAASTSYTRPTTVVRLVPSAQLSSPTSGSPAKGPLRLGDWVLPESPPSTSGNNMSGGVTKAAAA